MASTEQRAGFRLPWAGSGPAPQAVEEEATKPSDEADESASDSPVASDDGSTGAHAHGTAEAAPDAPSEQDTPEVPADTAAAAARDPANEADAGLAAPTESDEESAMSLGSAEAPASKVGLPHGPETGADAGATKPAKFLAELVRAMRAAADESRTQTLESFRVEAKTFVEGIHTRSADEATELRRIADDDIAGIREWSKAEIARIRSETEERAGDRKVELEQHLEDHAALIEREIEMVQGCVSGFEHDMDQFFTRLSEIDDPAAFASAAQQLPEPPSLEQADADARSQALTDLVRGARASSAAVAEKPEAAVAGSDASIEDERSETSAASTPVDQPDEQAEHAEAVAEVGETAGDSDASGPSETARAEVQFAETAANEAETAADETSDSVAVPIETDAESDPRLAALGLSGDLATAESEAAVDAASEGGDAGSIDDISEDSLTARLAGLVPSSDAPASGRPAARQPDPDAATTQVVVVGLVSVASIASFKRHLGRIPGVHSVGVSSGPDGEFVFKASHEPSVALGDVVTTLPGFGARVTNSADGVLNVSARDPESDA